MRHRRGVVLLLIFLLLLEPPGTTLELVGTNILNSIPAI